MQAPRTDQRERLRRFQRSLVQLEPQFLPLLASVLLPVILLPVTVLPLPGCRWLLPLLMTLLVMQSLRSLPPRGALWGGAWLVKLHAGIGRAAVALTWLLAFSGFQLGLRSLRFPVLLLSGIFALLATVRLVGMLARVQIGRAHV